VGAQLATSQEGLSSVVLVFLDIRMKAKDPQLSSKSIPKCNLLI
jgi:hypothetical protein